MDTSNNSEARERFRGFVHMTAADRRFLSRAEEKALMESGVERFGLRVDEARSILLGSVDESDFVLERDLDRRILALLEKEPGLKNHIGRKKFHEVARVYAKMSRGALSEEEARRNVKRVMIKNDFQPKRTYFASRRWFRRVDREKRVRAA